MEVKHSPPPESALGREELDELGGGCARARRGLEFHACRSAGKANRPRPILEDLQPMKQYSAVAQDPHSLVPSMCYPTGPNTSTQRALCTWRVPPLARHVSSKRAPAGAGGG